MKIYCMRHGEAYSGELDGQRSLTEQGRADITKLASFLSQMGIHVDHIMHSGKLRTIETTHILSSVLTPSQISESKLLYGDDYELEIMLSMIPTWTEDTLLVGHLPFIARLLNSLVTGKPDHHPIINFLPGTIACLEHYNSELWQLNWIVSPSTLP